MNMKRMQTMKTFFRTDFSDHREWLLSLENGEMSEGDIIKLSAILNEKDPFEETKGTWTVNKLSCAKVFYSGDNHLDLPTHPLFEKVVGIQICDQTRIYLNIDRS